MNKPASLAALSTFSMLACFAVGCSSAAGEDVASGDQAVTESVLVYDHEAPAPMQEVPEAEAARVIAKLFPEPHFTSTEQCNEGEETKPGIVPSVDGKLTGSFSSGGRTETLYIVSVWDCELGHADGNGATRFVITEPLAASGDVKVYANAEFPGVGARVNRMLDLDKDGQNELVITTSYAGQGIQIESPAIYRFAGSNLALDPTWNDFATKLAEQSEHESPFFTDSCNTGDEKATIAFARVRATIANGTTTYSAQRGTLSCPDSDTEQ